MEYSNIAHVGYIRGSPACVSAHCFWCRLHGHPVVEHSEDNLSNAGYQLQDSLSTDTMATTKHWDQLLRRLRTFRRPSWWTSRKSLRLRRLGLPPRESSEQPKTAYLGYQNAGEFPAPEYAHGHEFDIAALTQQLSLVAVAQSVESVSPGFGNDFVASVWEWPGEPNPVDDLGPPEWPIVPQQHTPPFSWEDHWHEVHARNLELSNNQDVNIGGGLEIDSEHIIRPLPVVTN
ncbi:hypothetical protein RHS01_09611 [Rhizoctonia solani]|uniref:Uncharacterized protein n=1 Tax=Rhizoctonia solani TaxID=456999 RepID=A0A8H7M387_9AGAM|nr:hypothetical protein RHS01_09611 [Rhizoctonia solani]